MSRGPHWALDELENLQVLARGGKRTIQEIAQRLDRSPDSIRKQMQRLGLSWRVQSRAKPETQQREYVKTKIQELCDEGYRAAEIARRLGISFDYANAVSNIHRASQVAAVTIRDEASDLKHLRAIAKASNGRGFPYCVAQRAAA